LRKRPEHKEIAQAVVVRGGRRRAFAGISHA
jgi:hypothetical protein